jgi:hypothetical protein
MKSFSHWTGQSFSLLRLKELFAKEQLTVADGLAKRPLAIPLQ